MAVLKEFTGELDKPAALKPFEGELDDTARQPLPIDVTPSNAGAGRGTQGAPQTAADAQSRVPAPRRGGVRTEVRPYGAGDERITPPAPVPTGGSVFDRAAARGDEIPEPPLTDEAMDWQSLAPAKQQEILARQRYAQGFANAPEARPASVATEMGAAVRGLTDNPVARGAVAGLSQLGQVGAGLVRAGADAVGAEGVADFARDAAGDAATVAGGAVQGLRGNDKLAADITSSIVNSLPAVALGTVGGPALRTLFAQSAAADYAETGNLAHAGMMGAAEALGERFGFGEQIRLLKGALRGMPNDDVAKVLGSMLAKEIPGEQATTAMQFLIDKVGPGARNPNATFADYLKQAGETLEVTIGQTAVMGGGPAVVSTTRNQMARADAATDRSAMNPAERAASDNGFLRPTEQRKAIVDRLDDFAATHGVSPKAVKALKERAETMPMAEVPGFFKRALAALSKRGLVGGQVGDAELATLDDPAAAQPEAPATTQAIEAPELLAEPVRTSVDDAASQTANSPTNHLSPSEAQQKAGNHLMGHPRVGGMAITIENDNGSTRRGTDEDGNPWETTMTGVHYGYFPGSTAMDSSRKKKQGVDVFVKAGTAEDYAGPVFVVDQVDPRTGKPDEHKVMLGFTSKEEAEQAYRAQYTSDWRGFGAITELPMPAFKAWVYSKETKKPLAALRPNDQAQDDQDAGVVRLATREEALQRPEGQGVPSLWRNGDQDGAGVGERLPGVLSGDRAAANGAALPGSNQGPPGVRAGQRAMGDEGVAVAESPDVRAERDPQRQDADGGRVGARVEDASDDNLQAPQRREASGRGAATRKTAGRAQPSNADTRRPDDATEGMGARVGDGAGDASGPARARVGDQPRAGAGRVIARAGRTPNSATPIELRANPDGTLTPFMEGAAMADYDTGAPIVLPADVTDLAAKQAIRAAGAVSNKTNFFKPEAKDAAAPAQDTGVGGSVRGDTAPAAAAPVVFVGKSALFDGFGASKGSISEGNRRQLMVDPSGGYYWGDWRQEAQRDVGAVASGADKGGTPASFATGKEAREAASSTPFDKHSPASAAPASAAATTKESTDGQERLQDGRRQEALTPVESQAAAGRGGPAAAKPSKLTPLDDERLQQDDFRTALEHASADIGWTQRGVQLIRSGVAEAGEGNGEGGRAGAVVGRTQWLGPELWAQKPEPIGEDEAREAIRKALAGDALTARQKRFVQYVLDREGKRVLDERAKAAENAAEEAAERAAIMAEAGIGEMGMQSLDDSDIPFDYRPEASDGGTQGSAQGQDAGEAGRAEEAQPGEVRAPDDARGQEARAEEAGEVAPPTEADALRMGLGDFTQQAEKLIAMPGGSWVLLDGRRASYENGSFSVAFSWGNGKWSSGEVHGTVQDAYRTALKRWTDRGGKAAEFKPADRAQFASGTQGPDLLTAPTPESLRDQAERRERADAADRAEQKRLADKAKADAELGDFALTGSDAPADVAAAGGQGDLLAEPSKETPPQPSDTGEQSSRTEAASPRSDDAINDRDHFTLKRAAGNNTLETVTFARGEYVRVPLIGSNKETFGEIDGISHARREFSVDGLWHPFGAAYKAERPAPALKRDAEPLSKTIERANKKHGAGLTEADRVPPPAAPVSRFDAFKAAMAKLYDGDLSIDDYRAAYRAVRDGADAVRAELGKLTKDELIRTFGIMRDGKKDELVGIAYDSMVDRFALGKSYGPNSYGMTRGGYENYLRLKAEALDALVDGQTVDDLAAFAKEVAARREEAAQQRAARAKAIADPKTIPEFRAYLEHHMREGKTSREARMSLTPEQRALMDSLWARETRGSRKDKQDEQRTTVRVAGQTVDGQIIATKHTKKGHDLFVVRLAERVSREDYETLNTGAKKIGGYYSSYRGGGAIPGFQFTTREQAEAFVKLAGGDASEAKAAAQERRDAFADDRSQTAAQRLTEMADALEERADESLGRERKANTERRARMAASAEAEAQSQKALARTMRNIAGAIEAGKAEFLDRVRQKVQVEMLSGMVRRAHDDQLRAKYPSYSDFEKHRGEAPTTEAADFAEFPSYTAYRSDLAGLARQLLEVEGTKLLGQRLMKVADDVSDTYLAFAKEPGNLFKLSAFGVRRGDEMRTAIFPDKASAERSLSRSGLAGKGIVFQEKRGVNRIILSPSEAIKRGIWKGDGDKRITLTEDFGAELVAKIGKAARRGAKVSVPWQFETAHDRLKALARMGIETPAEMRAALREFIGLRERAAAPDKVKQLERAMVGKKNDGFDFFPTPEGVADEMVETAGLEPGMRVLEPSAGMGHIAERIREAGVEPDVGEIASDRRELLEAKGFNLVARDFLDLKEGDYDRIVMNPPFSDGRDIAHVRHAYELLKPGGRLVAIMGEGAFSQSFKRAEEFRDWLESVGGTEEKLPDGTFLDPSLPVNTGANARMVVIDKGEDVRFSRGPARDEHAAWQALSENDELFALPKSRADTIEAIALDIDPAILVERDEPNDRWVLTLPGGDKAFIMMREPSPHGPHAFDRPADDDGELRRPATVRPGEVRWDERMVDDVWLNVSNLKPGHGGAKVYAIAGDFAHNTGRVFIGDPAGVSDDAMRRRAEAMLSSALRWGTTEHLAPHPDQVRGNKAIGMPPLQWKWGDDLGNLRRLIDVTVRALDNTFPSATNIEFDAATGTFRSAVTGKPVSREALGRRLDQLRSDGARQVAASASGGRTVARAAVWRSLLREGGSGRQGGGQRDGLLAQFAGLAGRHRDALRGLFSRSTNDSTGLTVTGVQAAVNELTKDWKNAPTIVVAQDMRDPLIPLAARRHDEHQRSLGATGDVRGFIHGGRVYLIADELPTHAAVAEVVFHEALGHYGLRGVFDQTLGDVLDQMATAMPERVLKKAREYGLVDKDGKYHSERARLRAAEEVLAEIASERPSSTWVQRAIAAIKQWLRDNIPSLAGLKLTDADVIALFIEPARRFVERGAPRAARGVTVPAFQRVWHGTPHRGIEKFTTDKVGTGEGAQAYGWGLYFASRREIAEHYRKGLSYQQIVREFREELPDDADFDEALEAAASMSPERARVMRALAADDWLGFDYPAQAITAAFKNLDNYDASDELRAAVDAARGQTYQVEIPEDHEMLAWDKPLSEQPALVRQALKGGSIPNRSGQNVLEMDPTGEELYRSIGRWLARPIDEMAAVDGAPRGWGVVQNTINDTVSNEQAASQWLAEFGIKGIKYLDGGSRSAGAGSHNYVVFDGADTAITDVMFSRGPQPPLAGVPAVPPPPAPPRQAPIPASGSPGPNSVWSMPEGAKLDNAIYKYQDKHVDLKRASDAIRAESRAIGDRFDAYLQEELYHGRAASRVEDFAENELRPLIAEMKLRAVTQERLSQYLHARHAEEANDLIAERGGLADGGSGMTTAEAQAFLAGLDPAERKRLDAVAAKVDAMIAKTREAIVDYGLEARDTVDGWAAMFKHYVPLQREEHDGEGMGIGQGFSIRGKEAKHRTGSTAAVSDILANVALQREKAIVRGEKNRVAVAMVGLALTNPNPDVWKVEQAPTEQVLNETTQQIERRTVPGYKSLPNVLVAKIKDGKGNVAERVVVFNERNDRAMRMATALKNLDAEKLEGWIAASAKVTRYFASINTQYNPVFGFTNLTRDLQAAAINLSGTPIDGRRAEVMAQAMKFLGEAARAGFRMDGIKDQALWKELQAEGGTTGFRDLYRTTEDRANAIKRELDPHHWMREGYGRVLTAGASAPAKAAQNVAEGLFNWLSDFNESLENVTRLAAYKVAIDHGMSRQRAASLAKNLTVNFNRGGAQKPQMGAMYAFFNAAMQGTARIAQTMFEMKGGDIKTLHLTKAGKAIIGGGVMLGVLQTLALAAAGFDDDDIPEFIKERNLILPLFGTNKKYITIPMPLGYHVLPNLGRRATELAIDGGKGAGKKAAEMFGTMLDAFNPLGGGGTVAQILSPTALDPMVALLENKDWTGQPIAKRDWNPVEPGFKNAREASSDVGKWIAQGINRVSGGTEFVRGKVSPTPDQIDYLIGQATGGVGRELSKLSTMASAARTGETLPTHKIPLVGRFYGDASQAHNQSSRFYESLTRMREHKATIDGLAKQGRTEEMTAYLKANPEAKMADVAERAGKKLSELRAARRLLIEKGQRDRVKQLEQQITEYMTTFNKRVDEAQAPSSGATKDQTRAPARATQEPATMN